MTFHFDESLLTQYGYLAVLVGTFFEGEAILVAGGLAAHEGYLTLPGVLLAAFCGSFAGDQLYFWIGRRHGKTFLEKRPKLQARVARVYTLLERYHTGFILAFRFMYGLRTVSPFVLGTTAVRSSRYVLLNMIGALLWAVSIGGAGYLFGEVLKLALSRIKEYQTYVIGGALLIAAVGALIHHLRARKQVTGP